MARRGSSASRSSPASCRMVFRLTYSGSARSTTSSKRPRSSRLPLGEDAAHDLVPLLAPTLLVGVIYCVLRCFREFSSSDPALVVRRRVVFGRCVSHLGRRQNFEGRRVRCCRHGGDDGRRRDRAAWTSSRPSRDKINPHNAINIDKELYDKGLGEAQGNAGRQYVERRSPMRPRSRASSSRCSPSIAGAAYGTTTHCPPRREA